MASGEGDRIAQARAGDEAVLGTLLEEHGAAVRQGLVGAIPQRWQSLLSEDDVMQQTYVDAFRDIRRFTGDRGAGFRAWLETLAKRNLLDALKMLEADKRGGDRVRVEPGGNNDSAVAFYEMLSGGFSTPSRQVARGEALDALMKALVKLPVAYRQVIEMYDLQGQPVEDLAAALQRSCGAIYMLRARAHRLLAHIMGAASKFLSGGA